MSLFADQLKTLIATLEAVEYPKSFDITDWYSEKERAVVDCGFAACICGHQAVVEDSVFFPIEVYDNFSEKAGAIGDSLTDACRDIFGEDFLACAIYEGEEDNRVNAAYMSCLFTHAQLKHPHLTKEKPTIKNAISFIKLALKKVEAVK
jgi:hypothetical protein